MRDQIKSHTYFHNELESTNKLISSMWRGIQEVEADKVEGFLATYLLCFKERFLLQYSMGDQMGDYNAQCLQVVEALEKEISTDFFTNDVIDCLCILVLTNQSEELIERYLNNMKRFECDNEIFYMMAGSDGYSRVKKNYPIEYYKNLFNSVKSKSHNLLYQFLDDWYKASSDEFWYNSHIEDSTSIYTGYWCLEAATIAKTHNILDDKILNHPHFPKDLII